MIARPGCMETRREEEEVDCVRAQDLTRAARLPPRVGCYNLRSPRFFAPPTTFFTIALSLEAGNEASLDSGSRLPSLSLRFLPFGEGGLSRAANFECVLENEEI